MSKKELAKLYTRRSTINRELDVYKALELISKVGVPAVRAGDKEMVERIDALRRVLEHYASFLTRDEERGVKARLASAAKRTKVTADRMLATAGERSQKKRAGLLGVAPSTLSRAKKRTPS